MTIYKFRIFTFDIEHIYIYIYKLIFCAYIQLLSEEYA